jgi:hypothetical protein
MNRETVQSLLDELTALARRYQKLPDEQKEWVKVHVDEEAEHRRPTLFVAMTSDAEAFKCIVDEMLPGAQSLLALRSAVLGYTVFVPAHIHRDDYERLVTFIGKAERQAADKGTP